MPKISNNTVNVYNHHIQKSFDVAINYNQQHAFYAQIETAFVEIADHMGDDELKDYKLERSYKTKYRQGSYKWITAGSNKGEVLSQMKKFLEFATAKTLSHRNVIIVFFTGRDNMRYNNHRYNIEHPQIGLKFGLTYAVETSVTDKKVYSTYNGNDHRGNPIRQELNLYGEASCIIPDTPENRETLESLYHNLNSLNERLKEFTATPEALLGLISSNQKLLG